MDDYEDYEDGDFATIQFGITVTEDNRPVVVMILPDIPDEDGEPTTILIGSSGDTSLFAAQLLQAGSLVEELADVLDAAGDADLSGIFDEYARRLNAPYN